MEQVDLSEFASKYGIDLVALETALTEAGIDIKTVTLFKVFGFIATKGKKLMYGRESKTKGKFEYLNFPTLLKDWEKALSDCHKALYDSLGDQYDYEMEEYHNERVRNGETRVYHSLESEEPLWW